MFHWIMLASFVLARAFVGLVVGLSVWAVIPMAFQWQPTVVMSGSMEKNIMTGDILVASPVSPEEVQSGLLNRGHVVLANDPAHEGTLFTHRIIRAMDDGTYMTKGDANSQADRMRLTTGNIMGVERLRIPFLGIPLREAKMGNFLPAVAFMIMFTGSVMLIQNDRERHRKLVLSSSRQEPRTTYALQPAHACLALLLGVGAITTPLVGLNGSEAVFSGTTRPIDSTFTTASVFLPPPASDKAVDAVLKP